MSDLSPALRLPLLAPNELNEAQRELYERLTKTTEESYGNVFTTKDAQGRFIGPFGIVMHNPHVGQSFYDTAAALSTIPGLSPTVREIAILVTGAHYRAEYAIYAHKALGLRAGLSEDQVDHLYRGIRPADLQHDESVAFDVASAMANRSAPLPEDIWIRAVDILGMSGGIALVHFVGFYAYTCIILNGFDAKVPS